MNKVFKLDIFSIINILAIGAIGLLMPINNAQAFSKLKSGFETITNNYLIPLSTTVAGAALIVFVILSYFKQDVYLKNVGTIFALAVLTTSGLEVINTLSQSFS